MKNISNNDVADIISDKKNLAVRQRERQIMSEQAVDAGIQVVSLGKTAPNWAASPTSNMTTNTLWDFNACGLPFVWTHYGTRGEGVNVFVLDTGIDVYHPAFSNTKLTAKSFVPGIPSPEDGCGHGTWVCGKIGGSGVGIAPNCNLYSLRVLDDTGSGTAEFTNAALEWILKQDVFPHVINMSLGSTCKNSKQEKLLWQLYKKGALIVVAAGNDGENENFYPADYSGVLAVSAVDKNKTRAVFSNFGADIAVCAPGVACYSAYLGGGFRQLQGTSMAAPMVAGLLTLGVSYALSKDAKAGVELRDRITSALEGSAQDLGAKGKDPYYGFGCIDGVGFFKKLEG